MAGRREQIPAVTEGFRQVPCRVQYVRRDQQVVTVRLESLLDRVLFDIQRAIVDGSATVAEPGFRLGEEARGNVRVGVFEPAIRKLGQHGRGSGTRARPDFDHPEAPAFRQCGHKGLHRLREHRVRSPCDGRFQIKVAGRRFPAAEQEGQGVLFPAKHFRQGEAGPQEQPDLDLALVIPVLHPACERLEVGGHVFRERILRTHGHAEPVVPLFHYAGSGEHLEEPAKEAGMFGQDAQRLPEIFGVHHRAFLTLPSQFLQRRERAGPRPSLQVRQQGVPVLRIHAGVCQVARKRLCVVRDLRRTRKEVRRFDSEGQGALAPYDLVQQVIYPLDCRQQGRPGRPFHRVSTQAADQGAVRIVNPHLTGQDLRRLIRIRLGVARGFAKQHVADDTVRQRPRQPHPLPTEGQIGRSAFSFRHVPRDAHDLEAAVEDERMHVQPVPAMGFRQSNLRHRLSRPGPCVTERAEAGTEVDPCTRAVAVVARDVHGRESVFQRIQVDLLTGFLIRYALRKTSFHVNRPDALIPLAVYLQISG